MSDFIDDGYSEEGHIAALHDKDGNLIHGPLKFKFRPALGSLVDAIGSLLARDESGRFWDAAAKAMARDPKLIIEWDETDAKGQPVAITEANLKRIRHAKFYRLWTILSGGPSDPLPDGTKVGRTIDLEGDSKN